MIKNIVFLMTLLMTSPSFARSRVVYYEPAETTLQGRVTAMIYPGAPNYNSIEKGDKKESGYYLILNNPVDVVLPKKRTMENSRDEPQKNIRSVQLVLANPAARKNLVRNMYVQTKGELFYWFSGHHHTKVLMYVDTVKKVSN